MTYILRLLLCTCLALLLQSGQAQQVIVNSNGDRVIMYPDGSWRPAEAKDSVLIQQYLQRHEQSKTVPQDTNRNEGEQQNYLIQRGHAIRSRITVQEKKV